MAVLQLLKGQTPGQQFPLDRDQTTLGRHPDCDIVLDRGEASRTHAKIYRDGEGFFIEDLKSRNGTYVNGNPLKEGERLQLQNSDRIKILDFLWTFQQDPTPPKKEEKAPTSEVSVDEDSPDTTRSTILNTLNLTANSGLRVAVRPEVKLRALIEISANLAKAMSVEEVLPKILESLFKVFSQADRGFILLADPASGTLVPKVVRHRRADVDDASIRISRTIINHVMKQKEALLTADAVSDGRFNMAQSIADFRIRSMMCVPMFDSEERPLGLVQVDTQDQQQRFEQEDLDVLASVASQAAFAIENAILHETLIAKQVLEREMDFAAKVQSGFLPNRRPAVPGYAFFDYYKPARQVGGDYFDYILLPDGRMAVIVADVSGKGVPAALLMAKLSSEVKYRLLSEPTPAATVDALNRAFFSDSWEDRFVTMVLFVVNPATHEVTLVNAGHMPPLLRRKNGAVEEIDVETGLPVGVTDAMDYGQHVFKLGDGETLTVYTDGFSEAMNPQRDLYGLQRLRTALTTTHGHVEEIGQTILNDVRGFIGQHPQSDDMCIVSFGRV